MKRWAIRHLRGAAQPPIELRGERAVGLLALWAAALALRPQVIVLGPLLPDVMDDLRVSHAVAGLLSTIPILCMGVFAPLAPWVAGRVGASRGIGLSLAVIAVFGLVRLWPAGAWVVVVLTVGVGLGMGMGNGILPVVTKERFADRPAFATGVYVFGINVGSLAAAAAAIPIARLGGGWRTPLAAFSLATALLAAPWLASGAEGSAAPPPAPGHLRPAAARPRAWGIAAIFALLTVVFYGANAWLPAYYLERGWSSPDAGRALAVFHLVPLFVTLPVACQASSPDDSFVRHHGHEFGHVLTGTLRVVVGFDEFVLEPGELNDVRTLEAVIEFDPPAEGLVIGQRMRVRIMRSGGRGVGSAATAAR